MAECTSHQVFDHLGQDLHHCDVSDSGQGHGGRWQDEVSNQDGLEEETQLPAVSTTQEEKEGPGFRFSYFSLPPDLVDGSLPPPLIRTVDHVIVHEAGSVDHFWDHSYGSLTREQISEGDGVKGSEMKLRLISQKNRIPLNFCEILDIEQWLENTPVSIYDCHINVMFFTHLGRCGCWAPGPSGQLSSVEWPFPCHRNSSRTETWALLWTQKAPAEIKTRSHTPNTIRGYKPNLKYTLVIEK